MNANIQALITACKQAGIRYDSVHKGGNVIIVHTGNRPAIFSNWTPPVNPHSIGNLCSDKDFLYAAMSPYVHMPKTLSFLDPKIPKVYDEYARCSTYEEIVGQIENNFDYPLIVKRNRGTRGVHTFRVQDRATLHSKLATIYDKSLKAYDYVALAQELIDIKAEFRAVFYKNALIFAYLKDTSNADYAGNLSPLHWDGAKASQVTDKRLLDKLEQFVVPGLNHLGIDYAGVDIALDQEDKLFLIEVNSSPGFDIFAQDCGQEDVVRLYSLILEDLRIQS